MKATITEDGMLTIAAETPLERYALGQWWMNFPSGADGECRSKKPSGIHVIYRGDIEANYKRSTSINEGDDNG